MEYLRKRFQEVKDKITMALNWSILEGNHHLIIFVKLMLAHACHNLYTTEYLLH